VGALEAHPFITQKGDVKQIEIRESSSISPILRRKRRMKMANRLSVMVLLSLFLAVLMLASAAPASQAQALSREPVLITFDHQPGPNEEALVRSVGGDIKYTYRLVPAIAASLPPNAIKGLSRNPRIVRIEPDIEVRAIGEVLPWGVDRIDAEVVHASGNTGIGVKVAILDTGIDLDHPDLNVSGSVSFAKGKDADDKNGHGTHVAGTIAALDNSIGVIGVAPEVAL
jgi:subtilisin